MSDLITIVIPTHNRAALLRQALRCAQAQTWPNTEIIVVDEASTDDTAAMLASQFPGIKIIRHDRPRGLSAARNAGIAAATGDWLHFWDDDDLMHPRHLEELLEASKSAPPGALVTGRLRDFAVVSGEVVLGPVHCAPEARSDIETLNEILDPRRQRTITHSSMLWPRQLFEKLSFDENLAFNEDFDLFVRSILDGWHIVGRPAGKYFIHMHAGPRITSTMNARRLRSPALSWIKWAGLLKSRPAYRACAQALCYGLMAQLMETAPVPEAADLIPQLKSALVDWGVDRCFLIYPPQNSIKRAVLELILRLGGPAGVVRFLAFFTRLRPHLKSYVDGFARPKTDEDRDDASAIHRFVEK